jgi:hypothetical protein
MARHPAPWTNRDASPTPSRKHRPVRLLRRAFDDLFERGWGGPLAPLGRTDPPELRWGVSATATEQGIVIRAEMPGAAEKRFHRAARPTASRSPFTSIDLTPFANQRLADPFPGGVSGNDLALLPSGPRAFAGIDFLIGAGAIHLGSARLPGPHRVDGIRVGRRLTKLHFLHSCACGHKTPDGTVIGQYVVHYEDGSAAEVPVVYGADVRDWWLWPGGKALTRGRIGWQGENAALKGSGIEIGLSVTTWENPCPRTPVASLDYVTAAGMAEVAPFCVSMTAEGR